MRVIGKSQTKEGAPAGGAPALSLEHVSKVFGRRRAVDNVSFDLPAGAFLSIFGPNGAGKSTLLRMLATLSRPTSGSAKIMGIDLKEDPDAVRAHIGLISHNSMLYGDLTAEENLMLSAKLYGIVNARERVDEMLDAVELSHRRMDVVRTFSRGISWPRWLTFSSGQMCRSLPKKPAVLLTRPPRMKKVRSVVKNQ